MPASAIAILCVSICISAGNPFICTQKRTSNSLFTHFLNLGSVNLQGLFIMMKLLGLLLSKQTICQVCKSISGHLKVLQACCSRTMHNPICIRLRKRWSYTQNGCCSWEVSAGTGSSTSLLTLVIASAQYTIQLGSKVEAA